MVNDARPPDSSALKPQDRDGPLPPLLLVLTVVTGLVDAVSYLKLGHVFVANMTGNVAFLGFAVAGVRDFSISASLVAIAAFMLGALAGGRLGSSAGKHRARYLSLTMLVKIALIGVALLTAVTMPDTNDDGVRYTLIVLLALAMGLQNAAARRLAVPDLTTTVLTLTLTGLAADSTLAGGSNPRPGRRAIAAAAMALGAAIGAWLVLHAGVGAVLLLMLFLLVCNAIVVYRLSSSSEPWTAGT
jgi:uncharacterized membrane protein YoaK (UPF0700 family)